MQSVKNDQCNTTTSSTSPSSLSADTGSSGLLSSVSEQNKITNDNIVKMELTNSNNDNLINAQRLEIKEEYLPSPHQSQQQQQPLQYFKFNNQQRHHHHHQEQKPQLLPTQQQQQQQQQHQSTILNLDTYQKIKTRPYWNESNEARERRLARNAERMRQKRANESELEYRARLARNAEANRVRRQNENEVQRAIRLMKNAARQRMRRANESPEERTRRLAKSAARMRMIRATAPRIEKPPLTDRLIGY